MCRLRVSGNHQQLISFHVIDCPTSLLVISHPWLKLHNPQIDWTTGKVTSWSYLCHANCLHSAPAPTSPMPQVVPEPRYLSSVPSTYHELAPVFSKHNGLSLPPHRPYDCAIDLQPGAPLPSNRLHNLSRPDREAMEDHIRDSLAVGIIRLVFSSGCRFFLCREEGWYTQNMY